MAKKYRISIELEEFDHEVANPRNTDNFDYFGHIIGFHRDYIVGDEHDWKEADAFKEWLEENKSDIVWQAPYYCYQHSGITVSLKPFSCPWDSGQIGVVYFTKQDLVDNGDIQSVNDEIPQSLIDERAKMMGRILEEFDKWLQGDIWRYEIFEVDKDGNEESVDTCGWIIGEDEARNMAEETVKSYEKDVVEDAMRLLKKKQAAIA